MNAASDNGTVIMTAEAMAGAVRALARDIAAAHDRLDNVVLLGILRRGRPLADRLAEAIREITGLRPRVGSLATTLYRDDIRTGGASSGVYKGETHFEFDVNGTNVVLVDDVIFAGRTARAAMDELMDYGRPECIQLACLVDRGNRRLPIQPDFLGRAIGTRPEDHVYVHLSEIDGEDIVVLKRAVRGDA